MKTIPDDFPQKLQEKVNVFLSNHKQAEILETRVRQLELFKDGSTPVTIYEVYIEWVSIFYIFKMTISNNNRFSETEPRIVTFFADEIGVFVKNSRELQSFLNMK